MAPPNGLLILNNHPPGINADSIAFADSHAASGPTKASVKL